MLRPASISTLLATVVAGADSSSYLQPHTAILALPESAEVYAFATTYDSGASGARPQEASSSRLSPESYADSTKATHDDPSIAALLKGLMLDPPHLPPPLGEAESPLDTLEGEERVQALAAVGTIAWREEVERIYALNRQARASRSASGSTAAGSSSGRARARGTKAREGRQQAGEQVTSPDSAGGWTQGSGPEDGRASAAARPRIALPGTSVVRGLDHDQDAEDGVSLVPLLLDCELGPILVMPLVASAPARKGGSKDGRSAPMSPPTPPSPDLDMGGDATTATPASPAMLLILNCSPPRLDADGAEEEEDDLPALPVPLAPTGASASDFGAGGGGGGGGGASGSSPKTPTGGSASAFSGLPRPESPAATFRRMLRRPGSSSAASAPPSAPPAPPESGASSSAASGSGADMTTPKGHEGPFHFAVGGSSGPGSSASSSLAAGPAAGAGDAGDDALAQLGAEADAEAEARAETQLWTSLYASAKAVARVVTPALVACGPALGGAGM